jgi:hypothetical protein
MPVSHASTLLRSSRLANSLVQENFARAGSDPIRERGASLLELIRIEATGAVGVTHWIP